MVARGDVFTLPIEKGPTRNLTATSGVHDKFARWSPDGKRIAFVSDASGEDEIWLVDQAGGKPEPLTKGRQGMTYAPEWSAEGTHLAFSDKDGKLFVLTLADRKLALVADDERAVIRDYAWSPKGAYLAFSMTDANGSRSLHVWSAADAALHRVTDDAFNEESPAWDLDGEYLYFLSDREFAPQISGFEWNFAINRTTGIFALTLRKDGKSPFPPQSDEVTLDDKKAEAKRRPRTRRPTPTRLATRRQTRRTSRRRTRRCGSTSTASGRASRGCRSTATTSTPSRSARGTSSTASAARPSTGATRTPSRRSSSTR